MFKISKKAKMLLAINVILLVVIVGVITYFETRPEEALMLSEAEMENLAKQRAEEYFLEVYFTRLENLDIERIALTEWLARELVLGNKKIFGDKKLYKAEYLGPKCIVAVDPYYGYVFVLPDEFNNAIRGGEISVDNENAALELARVYVLLTHAHIPARENDLLILQSTSDIPWTYHDNYSINPSEFDDIVEPPQVTLTDGKYQVRLYSWFRGNLDEWRFQVGSDGRLLVQVEEIATQVGDWLPPDLPTSLLGDLEG